MSERRSPLTPPRVSLGYPIVRSGFLRQQANRCLLAFVRVLDA
jgi:hypothetical protein